MRARISLVVSRVSVTALPEAVSNPVPVTAAQVGETPVAVVQAQAQATGVRVAAEVVAETASAIAALRAAADRVAPALLAEVPEAARGPAVLAAHPASAAEVEVVAGVAVVVAGVGGSNP